MLKDQDIIYFSNDWNADNRTSSHHIARQLSRFNRILYVEASGLRAPSGSSHDLKRILCKIGNFLKGARPAGGNVYVFSPLLLPLHKYSIIRKFNKFLLVSSLKRLCKKLGFECPILWIVIPHMSVVIGSLNEKAVIYYCVDDFSSLPGVESESIRRFDEDLTKKADAVFTPSEPLYTKKKDMNEHVLLSPHGVDVEHFSKVFDDSLKIPEDIQLISKPVIGFFGLIEDWIDLELVKHIALKKPEWALVLIGRVVQDISDYEGISNIYFLKQRAFESLPSYAKAFDVAMIPYVLNSQVMHANPIKLREYLAAGKPVVSVRTPEIEKFSDVVSIADTYDEFVENIQAALTENSPEKIKARTERIKDASWESRFENISAFVESVL